jgi:phosphatidate cytidylyltransferase
LLIQRIKTAVVILAAVLSCLYIGGLPFQLLASTVGLIAIYEYYSFATNYNQQRRIQCTLTVFLPTLGYLLFGFSGLFYFLIVAVLLMLVLVAVFVESDSHVLDFETIIPATLLGFIYPGLFATLLLVSCERLSPNYLFWVLCIIVFTDSFAYFGGSTIGGPKFSPRISPKKTISGTCVGLLAGSLISAFIGPYLGINASFVVLMLLGFLLATAGVFGDLSESLIKRVYGVKDSGTILPGHGGVLDRIDALLFAAPLLLLISRFLGA